MTRTTITSTGPTAVVGHTAERMAALCRRKSRTGGAPIEGSGAPLWKSSLIKRESTRMRRAAETVRRDELISRQGRDGREPRQKPVIDTLIPSKKIMAMQSRANPSNRFESTLCWRCRHRQSSRATLLVADSQGYGSRLRPFMRQPRRRSRRAALSGPHAATPACRSSATHRVPLAGRSAG